MNYELERGSGKVAGRAAGAPGVAGMRMIKTKIVATLGPASSDFATIRAMVDAGCDLFRLNFSHGSHQSHARALHAVRHVAEIGGLPVAVLQDLCGPKIRVGELAGGEMPLAEGGTVRIVRNPITGGDGRFSCTYAELVDDVQVGEQLVLDDGLLRLEVAEKRPDEAVCRVIVGGVLKQHKGINLPSTEVSLPSVTETDFQNLAWGIENEVDYVALSFVRSPDDLLMVRQRLDAAESRIRLIAKIEKPQAVERIDAIIAAADGIMVARGDLGVEMDVAKVPIIQKQIIRACQVAGKPVITATQMLESMTNGPTPTRAEVSDVANAIMDGTDAVMLSGETAVGKNPAAAVAMMNRIAAETETHIESVGRLAVDVSEHHTHSWAAVAHGASRVAEDIKARVIFALCGDGRTPRYLSKERLDLPVIGVTTDALVCRQMALHYGVLPVCLPEAAGLERTLTAARQWALQRGWLAEGDRVVIITGPPDDLFGPARTVSWREA
jgi:pyruvate kinase